MSEESPSSGSFFGGFAVGVVAGAIGYYLLGTDEGKKVKAKITKEWQEVKDELVKLSESSGVRVKPISLRGLAVNLLKEWDVISAKTKVALPPPKVLLKAKSAAKTRRSQPPKKTGLKFKGA